MPPLKFVPTFNYDCPAIINQGDEFYEIHLSKDGENFQYREDIDSWNFPGLAIECAKEVLKSTEFVNQRYQHAIVRVFGTKYPDGSPVPDGGVIWDSRLEDKETSPGFKFEDLPIGQPCSAPTMDEVFFRVAGNRFSDNPQSHAVFVPHVGLVCHINELIDPIERNDYYIVRNYDPKK